MRSTVKAASVAVAALVVIVLLVAGCASGSATSGTTPTAAVASAPATSSVASPVVSAADADDETSASAGASFAPGATGILPPATGTGPAVRLPGEPDPALTPGALNPAVTQATIHSTICVSGWTATIRPPESFTYALKVQQIVQYGYNDTRTASYEEDHLIALELGGAPADPRNLWPEPYTVTLADGRSTGADIKDAFETKLKSEVCAGMITLAQGQSDIGDHWVHAYYGISLASSPTNPATTAAPTAHVTLPLVTPVATAPPTALKVTFVSLPDPAALGGVAHLTVQTSPGASCVIVVIWPSGNKSGAGGLGTNPTAGADGLVSWDWNVALTTKPGTAKATVTCTLSGGSAQGTAQFRVG
jgi:hypothetical protein